MDKETVDIVAPNAGKTEFKAELHVQWNRVLREAAKSTIDTKILEKNSKDVYKFNRATNHNFLYKTEIVDTWLTPDEFTKFEGGDCEDFAIYKYFNLALPKFLAIGSLKADKQMHCVCVVYSDEFKNWVVLDNMTDDIMTYDDFLLHKFTLAFLLDSNGAYL